MLRWLVLLFAAAAIPGGNAPAPDLSSDLKKIDAFNERVQLRFGFETPVLAPQPGTFGARLEHTLLPPPGPTPALGMSRAASPPSFGQHFLPQFNVRRDFEPENDSEKAALTALESTPLQAGFYLFGRAILHSDIAMLNYRALKGPAAATEGAPRPRWYPTGLNPSAAPDALPDWKEMYPVARRAMQSFADGGAGFETSMGAWNIAVRPVIATQERCLSCHNSPAFGAGGTVVLHQPLGGVIYAFRRTPASPS